MCVLVVGLFMALVEIDGKEYVAKDDFVWTEAQINTNHISNWPSLI